MQEKVSVIVPIYKVEKYLDRCVNSIINQTCQNLEIILVDDGSPDNCPKLCEDYAKQYSRIKVVHKENGGLSSARNAGLDVMTGDFVTFVDSDDILDLSFIEKCLEVLKNENAQIVSCKALRFSNEEDIELAKKNNGSIEVYTKKHALKNTFLRPCDYEFYVAWGKLYKSKIFENLRFTNGVLHEDEYICHYLFDKCEKFAVLNENLYYYYVNAESITGVGYRLKRTDYLRALIDRADFFKEKYPALLHDFSTYLIYRCIDLYFEIPSDFKDKRIAQKETIKLYKRSKKYLKGVKSPSKKRFFIFDISPKLYRRLFR